MYDPQQTPGIHERHYKCGGITRTQETHPPLLAAATPRPESGWGVRRGPGSGGEECKNRDNKGRSLANNPQPLAQEAASPDLERRMLISKHWASSLRRRQGLCPLKVAVLPRSASIWCPMGLRRDGRLPSGWDRPRSRHHAQWGFRSGSKPLRGPAAVRHLAFRFGC